MPTTTTTTTTIPVPFDYISSLPWHDVPGFEGTGLQVRLWNTKIPQSQTWIYVPLIVSALGKLPDEYEGKWKSTVDGKWKATGGGGSDGRDEGKKRAVSNRQENDEAATGSATTQSESQPPSTPPTLYYPYTTPTLISHSQTFWRLLFSHWDTWVHSLRSSILRTHGSIEQSLVYQTLSRMKITNRSWTCAMVLGGEMEFGICPHLSGRVQEEVLEGGLEEGLMTEVFACVAAMGELGRVWHPRGHDLGGGGGGGRDCVLGR